MSAEPIKRLLQQAPEVTLPDATWGPRQPLPPKLPEAPSLPPEMLPEPLRPWLVDIAERACLPLEMLAAPAIVGLSGLIGRSVAIRPREYSDWTVAPNLWGAIVAPPGAKKSDALAEALRPLTLLEGKARKAHKQAELEARAEQALLKAQLQGAAQKAKKGQGSRDEIAGLLGRMEALDRLPEKRYTTQDATVEKLGELLRDNPRGIVLVRDELASWIAALEQEESAVARGFFLTAWNGLTGYTFDRIGRGTVHIPAACVSVVGGIQPLPLQAVFERLRKDPTRADGLLQRFQVLVWPDGLPPWEPPQSWPDRAAKERAYRIFERLDGLEFRAPDDEADLEPHLLHFTPEAGRVFAAWHDQHEQRLRDPELNRTPHFAGHIAKYGSLAASLAVVFHLVEVTARDHLWLFDNERWSLAGELPPVEVQAVHLALDWVEFLELHARKVYAPETGSDLLAAHHLAEAIEAGAVVDGMTVREVQRSGRFWTDAERLAEALGVLERLGWLRVLETEPGPQGGRPSEVIRLHPELRGAR
jgi:putative DNA primase/helicase